MRLIPAAELLGASDDGSFYRMIVQEPTMRAGTLAYNPGDAVGLHAHVESDELFHVLAGRATFTVSGTSVELGKGDTLLVSAGERHEIEVGAERLVLLAVVAPNRDDAWVAADH